MTGHADISAFQTDLFLFWRRVLMIACSVYAVIRLGQSAWTWYVSLRGRDRPTTFARQYLLIQLLRLSPRKFVWDLAELGLLAAVFLAIVYVHGRVGR